MPFQEHSQHRWKAEDRCRQQLRPYQGWVGLCCGPVSNVRPREQNAMKPLLCHQPYQPGMALGPAAGLEDLSEEYQVERPLTLKASAIDNLWQGREGSTLLGSATSFGYSKPLHAAFQLWHTCNLQNVTILFSKCLHPSACREAIIKQLGCHYSFSGRTIACSASLAVYNAAVLTN